MAAHITSNRRLDVAFIHPDLGIGGAERLVVDAAMAVKNMKNDSGRENVVKVLTSHCDLNHCFEEVRNGEFKVCVYGDFLPTNLFGKFSVVFAFLRQLYLVLLLIFTGKLNNYDLIFVDQLAYCIPLLHFYKRPEAKILFYCHFPDKLLASHKGFLRSLYRYVFDTIEEWTTKSADIIVVNSEFTKKTVLKQFKSIAKEKRPMSVVYPCVPSVVDLDNNSLDSVSGFFGQNPFFLSVNRFERKKHVELAIDSFALYLKSEGADLNERLVISGGYDERVTENKTYLEELKSKCKTLGLSYTVTTLQASESELGDSQVIFMPSIATDIRNALLSKTDLLLYTPSREHFGIVPVEAMRMGKLVLADNTGGPLETVVDYSSSKDSYTGFTVKADAKKWTEVLLLVKGLPEIELQKASKRCIARAESTFSFGAMQNALARAIDASEPKVYHHEKVAPYFAISFVILLVAFGIVVKSQ